MWFYIVLGCFGICLEISAIALVGFGLYRVSRFLLCLMPPPRLPAMRLLTIKTPTHGALQ